MALLGHDIATKALVSLAHEDRRSGCYVLGRPGTGKSSLLVNCAVRDYEDLSSVIFIDPHGQAIQDFIKRIHLGFGSNVRLLDPIDENYAFGINPLFCKDVSSYVARNRAYNKTFNIFRKIWADGWESSPWFQLILQNTLPVFIEKQEFTLAEIPLFLRDTKFREYVLSNLQFNTSAIDFWKYEFKQEQAQSALTRIRSLLSNDYVRHIVGQREPRFDFARSEYLKYGWAILLRLHASMAEDVRNFIGTIFLNELTEAIYNRNPDWIQYNLYVYCDEFQHFASKDFSRLILEARKQGCCVTIAHQERMGQFGENADILGATMACANKVIFQCTVKDARELAPEFAEKPTITETRLVPELVICKEPMWELYKRGHANPRIMEIFRKQIMGEFKLLNLLKDEADTYQLERTGHFDEAMMHRDHASLSGIDEKRENVFAAQARGRDIPVSHASLDRTEAFLQQALMQHKHASNILRQMEWTLEGIQLARRRIQCIDEFLIAIMEGKVSIDDGHDYIPIFMERAILCNHNPIIRRGIREVHYALIDLTYGDHSCPFVWKSPTREFLHKYYYKHGEELYVKKELSHLNARRTQKERDDYAEHLKKEYISGKRKDFILHGVKINPSVVENISYPAELPLGILSESERKRLYEICITELKAEGELDFLDYINEAIEFLRLLSFPENHIKVRSGQYVEKPVGIASTQEMVNQAVQTLTNLPRYNAYAKTPSGTHKITTNPLPNPINRQELIAKILANTREKVCRKRDEIEQELRERVASFGQKQTSKNKKTKTPPTKDHDDPPDQPEPPPQGWA